jgi:heptosyltransferase-2
MSRIYNPESSLDIVNPLTRSVASLLDKLGSIIFAFIQPTSGRLQTKRDIPFKSFKRILVIRCDHIGDVLMSTPVFKALRIKYPNAHIAVLVGSWAKELVELNPYINEVIVYDCPWWLSVRKEKGYGVQIQLIKKYWILLRKLRGKKYDLAIDLRGDFRQILLFCFLSGAPHRISYSRTGGSYLLTVAPPYPFHYHETEKNNILLKTLGIKCEDGRPFLRTSSSDYKRVEEILNQYGIKPEDKIVAIHPKAQTKARLWSSAKFAGLGDYIAQRYGAKVVIVGGKRDFNVADEIRKEMKNNPILLVGKTSLRELAVFLSRCQLLVCVESGILQLAATVNVPVIALYGPMRPEETKPRRANIEVITQRYKCSPCRLSDCPFSNDGKGACMEAIALEDVKVEVDKFLGANSPLSLVQENKPNITPYNALIREHSG